MKTQYSNEQKNAHNLVNGSALSKAIKRFKETTASIAVLGTLTGSPLAIGSMVASTMITVSSDARAQDVEIAGRKLQVIELSRPLTELDKETEKYRKPEQIPNGKNISIYTNTIDIPGEVRFTVGLDFNDELKKNYAKFIGVYFPPSREAKPDEEGAGSREIDLKDFATYVKQISGQEMIRVKIIVETGTFKFKGKNTTWTNAYILPLDSQGNILTRQGNGRYVIFGATYYADVSGGSPRVLAEPNNRETLASR